MTIAEQDEKDVKSIVATNFSKMFEQAFCLYGLVGVFEGN